MATSSELPPLTTLVSPRTLQRLQDTVGEAVGISSSIMDLDGKRLTKGRYNDEFLASRCHLSDVEAMKAIQRGRPHIYECQGGVYSFASPIMVEGKPIALIKGGQVRLANPDLKVCKQRAAAVSITLDQYLEHYLSLPLFTRERLMAAAELLTMVASTISSMAYAGLLAERQIQQVIYVNELLEAEMKRKAQRIRSRSRPKASTPTDVHN